MRTQTTDNSDSNGSESAPVVPQERGVIKSGPSKLQVKYWTAKSGRLIKREYKTQGGLRATADFWIRPSFMGRREWIPLRTPNEKIAAEKAVEVVRHLFSGLSWDATLAKFHPRAAKPVCTTVGQYLDAVRASGDLSEITVEIYRVKFYTMLSEMFGIRRANTAAGRQRWIDRIGSIRLARIKVVQVRRWHVNRLRAIKDNFIQRKRARNTAASIIRSAMALFSKDVADQLQVDLPEPLPMAGIKFPAKASNRYRSKIPLQALMAAADRELEKDHPDQYAIFLLALCCGLRRDEIDRLEWGHVDFQRNVIFVETTETGETKNEESEGEVDLGPEMVKWLQSIKGPFVGRFVVQSDSAPRARRGASHFYRCDSHFRKLASWLRMHGVDARSPLHLLRKEYGSLIARKAGIFAASMALRHSSIQTTRDYYLSKKDPAYVDKNELLDNQSEHQKEPESPAKTG